MKKIINISLIVAMALVLALTALYAVETALVIMLTIALIGLFALPIKLIWVAQTEEKEEKMIKKINIISLIISAVVIFIFCAIIDLEITIEILLTFVLIGMTALLIGGTWNGIAEIAAEIERRKELKRKQEKIKSLKPGTEYWVSSDGDITTNYATAQAWIEAGYTYHRRVK